MTRAYRAAGVRATTGPHASRQAYYRMGWEACLAKVKGYLLPLVGFVREAWRRGLLPRAAVDWRQRRIAIGMYIVATCDARTAVMAPVLTGAYACTTIQPSTPSGIARLTSAALAGARSSAVSGDAWIRSSTAWFTYLLNLALDETRDYSAFGSTPPARSASGWLAPPRTGWRSPRHRVPLPRRRLVPIGEHHSAAGRRACRAPARGRPAPPTAAARRRRRAPPRDSERALGRRRVRGPRRPAAVGGPSPSDKLISD